MVDEIIAKDSTLHLEFASWGGESPFIQEEVGVVNQGRGKRYYSLVIAKDKIISSTCTSVVITCVFTSSCLIS